MKVQSNKVSSIDQQKMILCIIIENICKAVIDFCISGNQ